METGIANQLPVGRGQVEGFGMFTRLVSADLLPAVSWRLRTQPDPTPGPETQLLITGMKQIGLPLHGPPHSVVTDEGNSAAVW